MAASLLVIKAFRKADNSERNNCSDSSFGEAAIQLLRDMRAAERINEKSKRVPRSIELVEERDRLLDCIDEKKRQQLIEEYSDSCA